VLRPTTVLESLRLSQKLKAQVTLISETFQHTGSFKFRAAYNVAAQVPQQRIITASSGNFGQALAYACRLLGKDAIVVMPSTAAAVKINAVREFGATVELVDVNEKSRAQRVAELAQHFPDAYVASAYDDPLVIEGNASLGQEIARLDIEFDAVIVPVGGGGLSAGLIQGLRGSGSNVSVIGAEPLLANDAARSLKYGHVIANDMEPQTLADGARTISLGRRNWEILHKNMDGIIEVPEGAIAEGVRLLFELANLKAEPTAALAIGALLAEPERFQQRSVCCIVSGGNVDPEIYRNLLT
jgi:threo-3-hydroxy-L-aspartate ammonia-lyase